ncbi:MAG: hypothetical protein ABI836_12315 [Gemmatimonadota bacterium]
MTFDLWLQNGWIRAHETSPAEIAELLAVADRNLADAGIDELSADARMGFAHAASIAVANAALAAAGYRPGRERHHERLIDSLAHTVGADSKTIRRLHDQRVSRNTMTYERIGTVTEQEAKDAVVHANELTAIVRKWLMKEHPKLMPRKK